MYIYIAYKDPWDWYIYLVIDYEIQANIGRYIPPGKDRFDG